METSKRESWVASRVISNGLGESEHYVKNVEKLLRSDHTIPFIARYRKEMTGDMGTEKLYKIKEQISRLDNLSKKIIKAIKDIEKLNCLTPQLEAAVSSCTSAVTLEQVTAAYKPGKKKSRAEQAKAMGLNEHASNLLEGRFVDIKSIVGSNENLRTINDVYKGVKDILAERLRTNKDILECCEKISNDRDTVIECTESKAKSEIDKKVRDKFDQYLNFQRNFGSIKPYQIMAVNRGENLKVLSVKINISDRCQRIVKSNCNHFLKFMRDDKLREDIVNDACSRLIFPLIGRRVRSALSEQGVEGSVDVFANNLKHLLLTRPITGIRLLALDPGFTHGVKAVILDDVGNVVMTDVIYLDQVRDKKNTSFRKPDEVKLTVMWSKCKFDTIAIGNGTGCRETERAVAKMISGNQFGGPVKYTIVDERGASIYSVTKLAQEELPGMDTNLRSAASIGRRLLDPLSEYVKIEPHHLGVGQYQHDIPQTKLSSRLDEIVTECVSFTGLDVNRCQQHMLERISGLTKARAKAIIAWRDANGVLVNRQQIHEIKGIGPKSYEQCIGFLRVYPSKVARQKEKRTESDDDADYDARNALGKRTKKQLSSKKTKMVKLDVCYLDQTSVHPESYHIAEKLMRLHGLKLKEIGTPAFVEIIKSLSPGKVCVTLDCTEGTAKCIITSLSQELDTDYRDQFSKPIFKSNITSVDSVRIGTELEGRVSNVTHFGAFVDIGLDRDGLIHVSGMQGFSVQLGQRVRAVVCKKDTKGIGLKLMQILD